MKPQRPAQSSLDLQSLFTQYYAVVRSFTQLCAVVRSGAQFYAAVRSGAQPIRSGCAAIAQWVRSGCAVVRSHYAP
jgi:hypothetical protein